MVALGHHLGADDDVDLVILDAADQFLGGARPGQGVTGRHRTPHAGEQGVDLLGQALDPGTAGDEAVLGLARRAGFRRRHVKAAVMALQPPAFSRLITVLDQPGRAARALQAVAAGSAQGSTARSRGD